MGTYQFDHKGGTYEIDASSPEEALHTFQSAIGTSGGSARNAGAVVEQQRGQGAPALIGNAPNDYASKLLHGATLGYSDEILAGLNTAVRAPYDYATGGPSIPERYRSEKAYQDEKLRRAEENTGIAGTAVELAGSMGGGGGAGRAVVSGIGLAGRNLPAIVGRVASKPFVQDIASGATVGGAEAYGNDQSVGWGAGLGAAGGAVGSVLGRGVRDVADAYRPISPTPTTGQIYSEAQQHYKDFENSGAQYVRSGLQQLHNNIGTILTDAGWDATSTPAVSRLFRAVEKDATGATAPSGGVPTVSPKRMQALRQLASDVAASQDPAEARIGRQLVDAVESHIFNPGGGSTNRNAAAGFALNDANENYTRYMKSRAFDEMVDASELRAASTYGGGNINNAMRQDLRRLLKSRKDWTLEEETALREAIDGNPTSNTMRMIGKLFSPTSPLAVAGQLAAFPVTGLTFAPLIAAAGLGAKTLGDSMTRQAALRANEVMRRMPNAPAIVEGPVTRGLKAGAKRLPGALAAGAAGTAPVIVDPSGFGVSYMPGAR